MNAFKQELSLTAIGMVIATIREDAEAVTTLEDAWGVDPLSQALLLRQVLNIAARGIELYAAIRDVDPVEWLQETALQQAAK